MHFAIMLAAQRGIVLPLHAEGDANEVHRAG